MIVCGPKSQGSYSNLIKDLHLKARKVPLLAGEVVNQDQGGVCASMNKIIATLPMTIHNSYVISSAGCTDSRDNLHFNAEGYRKFGKRYAAKCFQLWVIKSMLLSNQTRYYIRLVRKKD